jgi:hypothetical protein
MFVAKYQFKYRRVLYFWSPLATGTVCTICAVFNETALRNQYSLYLNTDFKLFSYPLEEKYTVAIFAVGCVTTCHYWTSHQLVRNYHHSARNLSNEIWRGMFVSWCLEGSPSSEWQFSRRAKCWRVQESFTKWVDVAYNAATLERPT